MNSLIGVVVIQMLAIEDRGDHVRVLGITTILQLLLAGLLKTLNELGTLLFICQLARLHLCAVLLVLVPQLVRQIDTLLSNLRIHLKLLVDFFWGARVLGKDHLPSLHVVRCLVLVCHQVSFYQRRVAKAFLLTFWFGIRFFADISQRKLNWGFLSLCGRLLVSPVPPLSGLNYHASK